MKKMILAWLAATTVAAFCLTGCGSSAVYADGTYTGQSNVYTNEDGSEAGNGYGVVTITIKDNKITECTYQTFTTDGTLKDTEYGKEGGEIANRDYYNKAQKAVAACDEYASNLVYAGDIRDVDAISGATINYGEFQEAVEAALAQAKQ